MIAIEDMNLGELAAFICSSLLIHGIDCVLTGGACVSIYSNNEYQSADIDFIESGYSERKKIKAILSELGFVEFHRYFKCDNVKYFIEFPSGPLAIASESVQEISEIIFSTGVLKLLSPTDCVKARLAAYYHWDDLQSLAQAISVSQNQKIHIDEIERWSRIENCSDKFEKIRNKLKS